MVWANYQLQLQCLPCYVVVVEELDLTSFNAPPNGAVSI